MLRNSVYSFVKGDTGVSASDLKGVLGANRTDASKMFATINKDEGIIAFFEEDGLHFVRIDGYKYLKETATEQKTIEGMSDGKISNATLEQLDAFNKFHSLKDGSEKVSEIQIKDPKTSLYANLNTSISNEYLRYLVNNSMVKGLNFKTKQDTENKAIGNNTEKFPKGTFDNFELDVIATIRESFVPYKETTSTSKAKIMKKLLGLLGAVALTTSGAAMVVSCGSDINRFTTPSLNKELAEKIIAKLLGVDNFNLTYGDIFSDGDIAKVAKDIITEIVSFQYAVESHNEKANKIGFAKIENGSDQATNIAFNQNYFSLISRQVAEDTLYNEYTKTIGTGKTPLDYTLVKQNYSFNTIQDETVIFDVDGKEQKIPRGSKIKFGGDSPFTVEVADQATRADITISAKTALSLRFQDYFEHKIKVDIIDNILAMVYNDSRIKVLKDLESADVLEDFVIKSESDILKVHEALLKITESTTGGTKAGDKSEDGYDPYFGLSGFKGLVLNDKAGTAAVGENGISDKAYASKVYGYKKAGGVITKDL
ncbi:hypothetical protein FQR65_LT16606 [Abscondita terminalis]|nr:hypothetical protein FQR65_LT16606 [Abscondita terminalis]